MEGKKNLCAMIPAELHARIMAEKEEMKLGTLAEYVERIFTEHFEGGNDMQTERTLAVKISAELFDRLKEYQSWKRMREMCGPSSTLCVVRMLIVWNTTTPMRGVRSSWRTHRRWRSQ